MIIECPKCKSTFKVAEGIEIKKFSNLKCSVCEHIWKFNTKKKEALSVLEKKSASSYSYVLLLNLVILVLVIIALIFYKDKIVYTNGFWTEFYEFFTNLIPIK